MSKTRKLFGVFFKAPNSMDEEEVLEFAQYVRDTHGEWLKSLSLVTIRPISNGRVDLKYQFKEVPVETVTRGKGGIIL